MLKSWICIYRSYYREFESRKLPLLSETVYSVDLTHVSLYKSLDDLLSDPNAGYHPNESIILHIEFVEDEHPEDRFRKFLNLYNSLSNPTNHEFLIKVIGAYESINYKSPEKINEESFLKELSKLEDSQKSKIEKPQKHYYSIYTHLQDENPQFYEWCNNLQEALDKAKEYSKQSLIYGTLHVMDENEKIVATFGGGIRR